MNTRQTLILLTACGALSAGCAPVVETSAYARPSNPVVDAAFVKPGVDFSRYTKLTTKGLEIYYPDADDPPPADDLARLRRIFREAFLQALDDAWPVVDNPGPDVLEVRAQLIDMKITGSFDDYTPTGRLRDLVARGELTLIMEVADSVSGEVLARAGDRTTDVSAPGPEPDWQEVEAAARHWAVLFRDWLDRSLGKQTSE